MVERTQQQVVLRGRLARPFAVAWFLLAGYLSVDVVRRADGRAQWVTLAAVLLVSALVYALSFRPAVVYDDDRLVMRNIVRDVTLPWARVDRLDWRYVLTAEADGRRYTAWALTANRSNLPSDVRQRRQGLRSMGGAPPLPGGSWPSRTTSGAPAVPPVTDLLRERWLARREAGSPEPVAARWARLPLALLAGATLLLAVALLT